jgi:glycerate dehydrogenase
MLIVILDGFTSNPGDLDWSGFAALGELTVHERTPPDLVVERAAGADAILTNKTVISADAMSALPDLRYIGVLATGVNVVALDAARARGIAVTNIPTYGTMSVAQATFALLLELTNHVGRHSHAVHEGAWSACEDFSLALTPLVELNGLTLGILGCGAIGQAVARIGRAFGMQVIAYDVAAPEAPDVALVDLDRLFAESDVLSLHCPLTDTTEHVVDAERIAQMKSSAFLLNTARGRLIDERALADALAQGRLAGAGLDVLAVEPPRGSCLLLDAPNCIITPHIAWATRAARTRLIGTAIENLQAFVSGEPINRVA